MTVFDLEAVIKLNDQAYEQGLSKAKKEMENLEKTNNQKSSSMSSAWNIAAVAIGNIISNVFSKVTSAISGAVDGAISRVDILNNYSIVMSGLGYSAEEADAAINKLSDGIQGLPTTLPGIVTVQKQFAALLGSMEDATDLTLALNNAVVAGGQGQEVANSALNQWYQILANGKPDLQSWRIINQAMPAQLDQLAKSISGTSANANTLFTQWQEGTITTDQVKTAIMRLNKEGISGFQNFAEQAQNASKGIATSMQNIKTKITTVLGNIIQSAMDSGLDLTGILDSVKNEIGDFGKVITESMSEVDFKEITDKVKELIKTFFDALKKIDWKKLITDVLNLLIKLVNFVSKNFNTILVVVKAIAAAFIGWKIGGIVNTMVSSIKGLISGLKSATTAQQGFNAAANANPIGLIITAVTTLIAIMPDLISKFREWTGTTNSVTEKTKELVEETEKAHSSFTSFKETLEGGIDSADAEAESLRDLADMLDSCYDSNGNFLESEQEKAQYILGELNDALGTEYTMNDLIITQHDDMKNKIYDVIEAMREKAYMQIYEEQYVEALKNVDAAYTRLMDTGQQLQYAQESLNYAMGSGSSFAKFEALKNYEDLSNAYQDNLEEYTGYLGQQSTLEQVRRLESQGLHDAAMKEMSDYRGGLGLSSEAQEIANKHMSDSLTTYMGKMLTDMGYTKDETNKLMSGITKEMDISARLDEIGRNGANSFGDSFTTVFNYRKPGLVGLFGGVTDAIKQMLGIASPSKVFKSIGNFSVQGFEVGWDNEFSKAQKNVMDDMKSLTEFDFGEMKVSATAKADLDFRKKMNDISDQLNTNLDKLSNMQIILDSGVLVGETAPKMDKALGSLMNKNGRVVLA